MLKTSLFLFLLIMADLSMAADIYLRNSKATVLINTFKGTTLRFPRPIRSIDTSRAFEIKEIVKLVDENNNPIDVSSVRILPKNKKSKDWVKVTLAGGKSIRLRLITNPSAQGTHRIHILNRGKTKDINKLRDHLIPQFALLEAMIFDTDSPGFERHLVSDGFSIESLEDTFDFEFVRKYSGQDYSGYVIEVENDTKKNQEIIPSWFKSINGQQITLVQIEDNKLRACGPFYKKNPSCKTKLRLVVAHSLGDVTEDDFELPFMIGVRK